MKEHSSQAFSVAVALDHSAQSKVSRSFCTSGDGISQPRNIHETRAHKNCFYFGKKARLDAEIVNSVQARSSYKMKLIFLYLLSPILIALELLSRRKILFSGNSLPSRSRVLFTHNCTKPQPTQCIGDDLRKQFENARIQNAT